MSDSNAVCIRHVTKVYRQGFFREKVKAVDELSLTIEKGSVAGLIGANGAGKSTTIYCMLGILIPDEGAISIFGEPPRSKAARRRLGFQSEIFHTYEFLKPRAALRLYGRLAGMGEEELEPAIDRQLDRLGLSHTQHQKIGTFSKGMKQRLGIAQALLHDPDLLILDEPFTGLDPQGRREIADIVFEEKRRGKTIFFSSHILSDIERLCDEVIMIRNGRKVLSGDLKDMMATDNQWRISVKGWERLPAESLVRRWRLIVNEQEGLTEIMCSGEHKEELLARLLQASVEIVEVRARMHTLEELYLELDQKTR